MRTMNENIRIAANSIEWAECVRLFRHLECTCGRGTTVSSFSLLMDEFKKLKKIK